MAPSKPTRRYRLEPLAAMLPALEAPDFTPGQWHDSERRPDGVWTMPYYELSATALAYARAVAEGGLLLTDFEWPKWVATPEAQALHRDRDVIARATPDQLARLLTALIRGDRFNEGALAEAFESGLMTAIARRAKDWPEPDA